MFNRKENIEELQRFYKNKIEDIETKCNRDIEELKYQHKIELRKESDKNIDLDRLDKDNQNLKSELQKLKKEIAEEKLKNTDVEKQTLEKEIEVLKAELKLKNSLITQLQSYPDVQKMINNLADLRVPAIEQMKEIFSIADTSKVLEVHKKIDDLREDLRQFIMRRR
jgi:hypothetical protein